MDYGLFASTPFAFFEMQIRMLIDAIEFGEVLFYKGPEDFDPIDITPPAVKLWNLLM